MSELRVEQLLESSRDVLRDCALNNGAIVAANNGLNSYPSTAENYGYSWPRDAAFQIMAHSALDLPEASDLRKDYLNWLTDRAQGFIENGLLIKRYGINGVQDWRYGSQYQPDQAAALLWSLHETTDTTDKLTDDVIKLLANGLIKEWDKKHFKIVTQDIWENRTTDPTINEVFTYTLSSTIHGLETAIERHKQVNSGEIDNWSKAVIEMRSVFDSVDNPYYLRKINPDQTSEPDNTIDASLSGLIYPFYNRSLEGELITNLRPSVLRRINSILEIKKQLFKSPNGVERYKDDSYDGISRTSGGENKGGSWPLLTFWHVIALNRLGENEAAHNQYWECVYLLDNLFKTKQLPNNLIPEQLFDDKDRQGKGVLPLAWSHAMFVLATKELEIA